MYLEFIDTDNTKNDCWGTKNTIKKNKISQCQA